MYITWLPLQWLCLMPLTVSYCSRVSPLKASIPAQRVWRKARTWQLKTTRAAWMQGRFWRDSFTQLGLPESSAAKFHFEDGYDRIFTEDEPDEDPKGLGPL